ncbi:MAG: hypothetical protein OEM59_21250 [Rhodospirillales bacterium]|nr:hypothetical protein [Rhodospirillales bacterium]
MNKLKMTPLKIAMRQFPHLMFFRRRDSGRIITFDFAWKKGL